MAAYGKRRAVVAEKCIIIWAVLLLSAPNTTLIAFCIMVFWNFPFWECYSFAITNDSRALRKWFIEIAQSAETFFKHIFWTWIGVNEKL